MKATQQVGVVGAGRMGAGIALAAALGGTRCLLWSRRAETLGAGLAACEGELARLVARGTLSERAARAARDHLVPLSSFAELAAASLVIETVTEDLAVKRAVLGRLGSLCLPDTVLASNTSALPLDELAAATGRPDRFLGLHFLHPAVHKPLCELLLGSATSETTAQRARALAESWGKRCVTVDSTLAGSVSSRLFGALVAEAMRLHERGAAPAEDIDALCEQGLGHAMGPLRSADLTGLDVVLGALTHTYETTGDPVFAPPRELADMVAGGRLGRASGSGFHDHAGPGRPRAAEPFGAGRAPESGAAESAGAGRAPEPSGAGRAVELPAARGPLPGEGDGGTGAGAGAGAGARVPAPGRGRPWPAGGAGPAGGADRTGGAGPASGVGPKSGAGRAGDAGEAGAAGDGGAVGPSRARIFRWSEPAVSLGRLARVDGLDLVLALARGEVEPAPFAGLLGIAVEDAGRGQVTLALSAEEFHATHTGIVHGGATSALCDAACGYAAQTLLPAGSYAVSADLSMRFVRPVPPDGATLRCAGTARHVREGRALAQAEVTGADGTLLAHATATVFLRALTDG